LDKPHSGLIDRTIEDFSAEREPDEPLPSFVGATRVALDSAFCHNTVEEIIGELQALTETEDLSVKHWASETLAMLLARSPTSLKVALEAIRRGRQMTLGRALNMELKIATAFCVRPLIYGFVHSELFIARCKP
jgi:3-hydroxyisobutyryl-CoA hydrolase